MNKKIIIIALAALLVGGGGSAAFFMFVKKPAAVPTGPPVYEGPAGLVDMDEFLVNVTGSDGSERFAKLRMRLTVVPMGKAAAITEDPLIQAQMRDRILTLLTTKDHEELASPIGKEGFRREVKTVLDPLIEDGAIEEVLFQDFVVQ